MLFGLIQTCVCIGGAIKVPALICGQHFILHGKQLSLTCPSFIPSKSANFRGVTLDLHKSAEIGVAVWKMDWCGATWRVVALYCTMGITYPKGEGQSPRGTTTPHYMGDPMVTDAPATFLLAWLEKG